MKMLTLEGYMLAEPIVLITGATDGVGRQLAARFASQGATVLIHGRSAEKGATVLEALRRETGNDRIEYYRADFASLAEVRAMAREIAARHDRIDILINNAGVGALHGTMLSSAPDTDQPTGQLVAHSLDTSKDGFELRLAVNHLAAFLLTNLLKPLLARSAAPRVVAVSSTGQSPIEFDDLPLEKGQDEMHAYRRSKFAQVMFTFEAAERMKDIGLTAVAVHPASRMATKMVVEAGLEPKSTVEEGVNAIYKAATDPALAGKPELFFNSLEPMRAKEPQAYDSVDRARFWTLSEQMTGLTT
jgi:NAD(P)-dependent dehydrogenase (short-subunit alcohol dehydrogenase family)